MKTIWKYDIPLTDRFSLEMPRGSRVLSDMSQHGLPHMWFHVDTDAPMVRCDFAVVGTGNQMPDHPYPAYVGSFQLANGGLVFHVFEVTQ